MTFWFLAIRVDIKTFRDISSIHSTPLKFHLQNYIYPSHNKHLICVTWPSALNTPNFYLGQKHLHNSPGLLVRVGQ